MQSPRCGFRQGVGAAASDAVEEAHHERGVAHAQLFFLQNDRIRAENPECLENAIKYRGEPYSCARGTPGSATSSAAPGGSEIAWLPTGTLML
jgi:hypothetical protein